MARQSRQAERGGARRISGGRERGPARLPRCIEGWPYVVPTWYQWADGGFYIIPRARSAWARYMADDGRVSISIDSHDPPYVKIQTQGEAEVIEEPNVGGRWVEIANEMSLRYLGENGPKYLVPTLNEPRWLFFVKPTEDLLLARHRLGPPLQAQRMGDISDRGHTRPSGDRARSCPGAGHARISLGQEPDIALLLHEPGADLDAWGPCQSRSPASSRSRRSPSISPGMDYPTIPGNPRGCLICCEHLSEIAPAAGRRFLISAGDRRSPHSSMRPRSSCRSGLSLAADRQMTGWHPPRSPASPKLVRGRIAGRERSRRRAAAGHGVRRLGRRDRASSRRAGNSCSLPRRGERSLVEEIVTFLRDCQRRAAHRPPTVDKPGSIMTAAVTPLRPIATAPSEQGE